MENRKNEDIIILKEKHPYSNPLDNDPACGVNFFKNIPVLKNIGKRIFLFGKDRACTIHDAEDVARDLKEVGALTPKENDDRFARGMKLQVENTEYSKIDSGFARWWDTKRAELFPWIARQYTKYFRKN